jgi:HAD superfamily hydrolase (TIGR01509 family)
MDGVLIDSNPLHREAWKIFNRRFGVETTEAMLQSMYGKRNDEIVIQFFGDLPADEVARRGADKERLYREMIGKEIENFLVPGIRNFLESYRDIPMAVASNAEPENVAFVLQSARLEEYFRVTVDGSQVKNPKPHPDVYLQAAERLGVEPRNCVVFEDSFSGVEAALAARMRVIGLRTTHGYLPGTVFTIDNFKNGDISGWMRAHTLAI